MTSVVDLDLAAAPGTVALPRDRVAVLVREGSRLLGEEWFDWRKAPSTSAMLDDVARQFGERLHARSLVHPPTARPSPSEATVATVVVGGTPAEVEATLSAVDLLEPAPSTVAAVPSLHAALAGSAGEADVVVVLRAGSRPLPSYVDGVRGVFALGDVAAASGPVLAAALRTPGQRARARALARSGPGFGRRLLHRDGLRPKLGDLVPAHVAHVALRRDVATSLAPGASGDGARPAGFGWLIVAALLGGSVVATEPDMAVRVPLPATRLGALAGAWSDGTAVAELARLPGGAVAGSPSRFAARSALEAVRALKRGAVSEAVLGGAAAAAALVSQRTR